jgi:hypothetical protein
LPRFAPTILLSFMLSAAAGASSPVGELPPMTGVQIAQVTIEQRVIIRIPTVRPAPPRGAALAPMTPMDLPTAPALKEVKGPKCLKLGKIRGAVLNASTGVTMLTDKDERFRAHFGRTCRAADFYSGFYIQPNKDGSVCAGRDTLHARNGASCNIESFAKLVPDR